MDTPPDDTAADNGTAPMHHLPEGAVPIDGMPGYHHFGGSIYGPNNEVIGTTDNSRSWSSLKAGWLGAPGTQAARIVGYGQDAYWQTMARQHQLAQQATPDPIWIEHTGERSAIYGTIKNGDHDVKAMIKEAGGFTWAPSQDCWVIPKNWKAIEKRDDRVRRFLELMAAKGRYPQILGTDDSDRRASGQPPAPATASAAAAAIRSPATAKAPASSDPTLMPPATPTPTAPTAEPAEPEDLTALSYDDLVVAEDAAARARTQNYTSAVQVRYDALRQERGKRLLDRVATAPDVSEMSDDDLAAESSWWKATIYKTPFHSSDDNYRTLEQRYKAVTGEQDVRIARAILAGPAPAELDDTGLEDVYERIGRVWIRLPRSHEVHDQVAQHRKALQEERVARRVRAYTERPAVADLTDEDLATESDDLASPLTTLHELRGYDHSEPVQNARAERLRLVEAEWDRRATQQHPEAARAELGEQISGKSPVLIDGSRRTKNYGYVERQGRKFRALANWDTRSSLGDFDSRPAAVAALVRRYDQDPATLPRRTWGREREVPIPVSAYDPLVSWLKRRAGEASAELGRMLEILAPFPRELPTQQPVVNPLTNKAMRAYFFSFEEGLLGELARVAESTTQDLREQSIDDQLPKQDREAAKRRIPAMGAALIGINATIEEVRAAGGDVERRGVDQNRLAAQMAALAGTVMEQGDQDSDDSDESVRDAAASALGGVPTPGASSDARPGGVLPEAGNSDGRGDRLGRGRPGGSGRAGDGLPGPGGTAAADSGDRAGDGDARDASVAGDGGRPGGTNQSGGSGAGSDPQGVGEPVSRFRPDPADLPRGQMARAEANLEAIKVLRQLEQARRGATVEEQRILARWSGWGSVPTVFLDEPDPDDPVYKADGERAGKFQDDYTRWNTYSRIRGELGDLLDPFQWRAASKATLSAHYTPQAVAEAMWSGLAAFGFDGGEVLEAGCGSGAFFGVAPESARLTGVEVDTTTAAIAGYIYPHANVLAESFADTDVPTGTFDAVIGNVPFDKSPFGERRYGATGRSLHNGFIIKQLALLRPGTYMAVITSRWTLDGEDTAARRAMARYGDLAGAYRLPAGTFGDTADVNVVADVLVFRRRFDDEEPADLGWIDAPKQALGGATLPVNAYITEHPENVLGRLTTESGPWGQRVTVQGDPLTAGRLLAERMQATAAAAIAAGRGYTPHPEGPDRAALTLQTARDKHATDFTGRLYVDDQDQIWQHINGEDPVRVITADGATGTEQLRALLALRDVAIELQDLDRTGDDPTRSAEVRGQLARLHADYTATFGPLSRPRQTRITQPTDQATAAAVEAGVVLDPEGRLPTAWGWFRQDPHAAVVLGLEHWDRAGDRPVLSEVLTRRPGARRGDLVPTDDPKTALSAVMGATGRVDLPLIASLLRTTPEDARRKLGTEVFDNPVTKQLEHASAYLSGAVRQKLDDAMAAAATDPTYAVNVAALQAVQPTPKRLGQFTAQLGAHWLPADLVQGFLREYLGDPTLQVSHNELFGWSLATGKVPDAVNALRGTDRRSAVQIARALLGRGSMVVNDLDGNGVDEDATRALRYKADAMRSAFEEYCTATTARVNALTDAYNRQMNGHVVRSYAGLSPTLAGFTNERDPFWWQLAGAARMQFERGVILDHEVGLGKTTTMVLGSQALKASGQIAKPYAVVQPHLARQWLDEAKMLYPNADIHLITSDDLSGGNRRKILEWLRSNTPDLVIFTEGAFGSIRMSPEQQELYLFREIEALKEQLKYERGVPHNGFALMKLEQRLATVETRIRRNDAPMRNPGEVYWDDLGFDYACIDEAHRFTAVGFRSKEAGGETASIRGVDLHQKLMWHHRNAEFAGGRPTVTLGSGTPIENSIFEQYTLLELATPWLLDQFGVHGPHLWSETFGQKVQRIEMAPDGSGLTVVERFSRFISKSTMKTMWGLAADTRTADEVGIKRPKVAGGAPELVLVEPTADQRGRLQTLVSRGQAIHAGDVTREEDNMLAVSGEGRAVALDPRLVDANAPAGNKLTKAADIIAAGYHAHKDRTYTVSTRDNTPHPTPGGLFFVFCNSGTPGGNNKGNFNLYAELRNLLVARGVPHEKVVFAQDNASPEKKAAMAQAANNGGIAVLMGSTEVLGTGFNGQNRAYALMHLDQDWTPASMIQRNGRVIRTGNQHEEVNIYFLATKGSMDAWQVGLLTSKAEGLRDLKLPPGVGDDDNDTVEEIGETDWDYATMAAEIGDNPYMRHFMEAQLQLQGLESDRRNNAADRVRQAELLAAKETELASTLSAISRRQTALPKITDTIRADAFRIRIGNRDFDQRGEAGAELRQAVAQRLRDHRTIGLGEWSKIGTFGGLDFAVRPEILDGSEIRAHVGFPDLRHSEFVCSIGDLANPRFGGTIIGRLATALEKAGDQQIMDQQRVPVLEAEIVLLSAQQAAVDYGPAIEHARRRVALLDAIVGAVVERDKLPELTESMLDPEKYPTPASRRRAVQERTANREPHVAKVGQAVAALTAFDQENPAPELPTAPRHSQQQAAVPTPNEQQGVPTVAATQVGAGNEPEPTSGPAGPIARPTTESGAADAVSRPVDSAAGDHDWDRFETEPSGPPTDLSVTATGLADAAPFDLAMDVPVVGIQAEDDRSDAGTELENSDAETELDTAPGFQPSAPTLPNVTPAAQDEHQTPLADESIAADAERDWLSIAVADPVALAEALQDLSRFLPAGRPKSPVLQGIKVSAHDGTVTLEAGDGQQFARRSIPANIHGDGQVLTQGILTRDILLALKKDKPLTLRQNGSKLVLEQPRIRFTLQTLPVEDYPSPPPMPDAIGAIDAQDLARLIDQVRYAVGKSAGRDRTAPAFTNIELSVAGGVLQVTATDTRRVAVRRMALTRPTAVEAAGSTPAAALLAAAKGFPPSASIQVSITDSAIAFDDGVRQIVLPAGPSEFAEVRARVPEESPELFTARSELLQEALRRLTATDPTARVRITSQEEATVTLQTVGPQASDGAAETVSAVVTAPVNLVVNADHLRQTLRSRGKGMVTAHGTSSVNLAVFPASDGYDAIVSTHQAADNAEPSPAPEAERDREAVPAAEVSVAAESEADDGQVIDTSLESLLAGVSTVAAAETVPNETKDTPIPDDPHDDITAQADPTPEADTDSKPAPEPASAEQDPEPTDPLANVKHNFSGSPEDLDGLMSVAWTITRELAIRTRVTAAEADEDGRRLRLSLTFWTKSVALARSVAGLEEYQAAAPDLQRTAEVVFTPDAERNDLTVSVDGVAQEPPWFGPNRWRQVASRIANADEVAPTEVVDAPAAQTGESKRATETDVSARDAEEDRGHSTGPGSAFVEPGADGAPLRTERDPSASQPPVTERTGPEDERREDPATDEPSAPGADDREVPESAPPRASDETDDRAETAPIAAEGQDAQDSIANPAAGPDEGTAVPGAEPSADEAEPEVAIADVQRTEAVEDGALFNLVPDPPLSDFQPPALGRNATEDEPSASRGDDATDVEEPAMTESASEPEPVIDAPDSDDDPQYSTVASAIVELGQQVPDEPGALFDLDDILTGPTATRAPANRQPPVAPGPPPPPPPTARQAPTVEPYPDRISSRVAQAAITRAAAEWNTAAAGVASEAASRLTADLELVLADVESLRVARIAREADIEDDLNVEGYTELLSDARTAANSATLDGHQAAAQAAERLADHLDTYLIRFAATVDDRDSEAFTTWSASWEPVLSLVPDYQWRDGTLLTAERFARRVEAFLSLGGAITVGPDTVELRRQDGETTVATPIYPGAGRADDARTGDQNSLDTQEAVSPAAPADEEVADPAVQQDTELARPAPIAQEVTDAPSAAAGADSNSLDADAADYEDVTGEDVIIIGDPGDEGATDDDPDPTPSRRVEDDAGAAEEAEARAADDQPTRSPAAPSTPDTYIGNLTPTDVVYAVERFVNATPGLLADLLRLAQDPDARREWIIATSATAWSTRGWRGSEDPDAGSHERLQVTRDGLRYVIGGPTIAGREGTVTWRAIIALLTANTTPVTSTDITAATAARRLAEATGQENDDLAVEARGRERELSETFWSGAKAQARATVSPPESDNTVAETAAVEVLDNAAEAEAVDEGPFFVDEDDPVELSDEEGTDSNRRYFILGQADAAGSATPAATEEIALFDVPAGGTSTTEATTVAPPLSETELSTTAEPSPASEATPLGQVPLFDETAEAAAYPADLAGAPADTIRPAQPQNSDGADDDIVSLIPEPVPDAQQATADDGQAAEPDAQTSERQVGPPPDQLRTAAIAGDADDLERAVEDTEQIIGNVAATPQWQQIRNIWGAVVNSSRTTSAYLAAYATRADAGIGDWLNDLAVRAARNVSRGALAIAGALARRGHHDTGAFRALMTLAGRAHEFVIRHTRLDTTPTTEPTTARASEALTIPADAATRVDAAFAAVLEHEHTLTNDPQWSELTDLRGATNTQQLQQAVQLARGLADRLAETPDNRGARTALRYLAAVIPVEAPDLDAAHIAALDDVLDRFRDIEQRFDADEEPAPRSHTADPEADLLASLANEHDQLTIVSAYLTPNDFQDQQMGRLFGAMAQAHDRGEAWSLETAAATLPLDGPVDAADAIRTVATVRERMLRRGLPAAPLLAQQVLDVRATSAVEQTLSRNGAGSTARRHSSDRDPAADTRRSEQDAEQHHTVGARQ